MNYKEEIIKIIENLQDEETARIIYYFVTEMLRQYDIDTT